MPDFLPGHNDPSPITRVIILDFYDGALGGVMEVAGGGGAYRFECVNVTAEEPHRAFDLRPLPAGSFDRLAGILGEHLDPRWPVWMPVWAFSTDDIREEVERRTDGILELAGEPRWRITTTDTVEFRSLVAEPVRSPARAV